MDIYSTGSVQGSYYPYPTRLVDIPTTNPMIKALTTYTILHFCKIIYFFNLNNTSHVQLPLLKKYYKIGSTFDLRRIFSIFNLG